MQNLDFTVECNFSESLDTIDKHYTTHPKYEMFMLIDGDVTMLINSQRYRITNGALVMLTSRDLHLSINNTSTVYKRITIMFDPKVVQMFNTNNTNLLSCFAMAYSTQRNIVYLSPEQIEFFVSRARTIAPCWGSKAYGADLTALSALISLLIEVNGVYRTQCTNLKPLASNPVLQEMVGYIDAHLDTELTVHELCQRFSYSEAYVSSLFSKQMGVTLKRFIVTKKIALAKQLLQEAAPVMQVCEQCGFNDYSNFIRTFKKVVGVSPTKWKREQTLMAEERAVIR